MSTEQAPQVLKMTLLNLQVCVPNSWTPEQIRDWSNTACECGTTNGWIVPEYETNEHGVNTRVPCANGNDMVHVLLVC